MAWKCPSNGSEAYNEWGADAISFDYTVATSPRFASILMGSFGIPRDAIWVDGLPRNDILTRPNRTPAMGALEPGSFVVWLPTFRETAKTELTGRGEGHSHRGLPSAEELDDLVETLQLLGLRLLVKPHPRAAEVERARLSRPDVLCIDEKWLIARGETLYSLLAASTALITDYSSVAVDYLVTGRPVYFLQSDASDYEATRGTNFTASELRRVGLVCNDVRTLVKSIRTHDPRLAARHGGPPADFYSAPTTDAAERVASHAIAEFESR